MTKNFQGVIRIDFLQRMLDEIKNNNELEEILGAPVDQHFALTICNGSFKFNPVYMKDEGIRDFSNEEKQRVREIDEDIIRANRPGMDTIPGLM